MNDHDHDEEPAPVNRKRVPEKDRLAVTEKLFGVHFPLQLEPVIYGITGRMAEAYSGGYWAYYTLNNSFYMAPDGDQTFQVSCDNYWTGKPSADALGIVSCLYAYSHLSFSRDKIFGRLMANHYHWLREYMFEHAEVAAILGAID